MQCAQCGEPIPAGARFCGSCGAQAEAAPPQDLTGQTVAGRYKLVRLIAEGGMGSVYEGEQALGASRRAVAVKLLRPEFSHDPAVKARFEREAATVARLEHFNTVRVYDFGTADDGTLFIVMEYVQGRSLQSVLEAYGALPAERVVRIASQVAASLEEAHGLGIVHRDLKPDNILLIESYASERDVVKLVDFGIAKGQPAGGSATTKLTELGTFVGTPAYMSPEQFAGGGVNPRSDIYSLGVTTYQMLAGRLPFEAESILDWAQAHLNATPSPLAADHGAGPIPEHMRRAVLRALAKDPAARQVSASQLALELAGRGATNETQAAEERPAPVVIPDPPVGAAPNVAPGPMKTAPMTQLPEVPARGPATTQPMAQVPAVSPPRPAGVPLAPTLPPAPAAPQRRSRGWLWAVLALLVGGGTLLALILLRGTPWQLALRAEPEPPPLLPAPGAATSPEPEPPVTVPPEPVPSLPEPTRPEPAPEPAPSTRSPAPRPAPAPAPPLTTPAPAPNAPAGVPPIQLPPGVPSPAPTAPAPPATSPTLPPGLPQLPWSLPTAGSCERCLAAVRGTSNYAIVNAVAENVLCEDRAAREACEREIEASAPAVAERAARGGDCPAALATVAAAMNVRLSPDKFAAVNALCLR